MVSTWSKIEHSWQVCSCGLLLVCPVEPHCGHAILKPSAIVPYCLCNVGRNDYMNQGRANTAMFFIFQMTKRSYHIDSARSVCPSRTEWRVLHTALDINDTLVQIFQPDPDSNQVQQWFYTVTCKNELAAEDRDCPRCCIGIDHTR